MSDGADSKLVKSAKRPPNAGKGRKKGVPNKTTAAIKTAIMAVYEALQEGEEEPHGHFLNWARETPTEFYKLASKLLPLQLTGDDGDPLSMTVDVSNLSPDQLKALASVKLPTDR